MFSPIFDRFAKDSPVSVIARAAIERVLNPTQLNEWFDSTAKAQYTKELLFSTVFDIISQVVCESRRSVNAAYQASKEQIGVSITSLYNKLNGIESNTSAELVRYAAGQVAPVIEKLDGAPACALPGFRIKLLDGNCIEKSQHRIKELRSIAAGPLPGKSLVVYDPLLRLPIDVFPCEDGHAQERSLLTSVLQTVMPRDVWIADRNFCTLDFTCGIDSKGAFFIIREHRKYPFQPLGEEIFIGEIETGTVYEQPISVIDQNGKEHIFRRCRIRLKKETRDGDSEICIISNLPQEAAEATKIADQYRTRWTIGVSRKGRVIQSVKVRPRLIDLMPRSLEGAVARKQCGKALRQHSLKGGCATYQVVTYSERRCSLVTRIPVAETVDNVRRQQEIAVMGHIRCFSPAGYQRRHGTKDYVETGEALDARRRNLDEEFWPITLMGKWPEWCQGGGSGCTTVDPCAAKHTGREGAKTEII